MKHDRTPGGVESIDQPHSADDLDASREEVRKSLAAPDWEARLAEARRKRALALAEARARAARGKPGNDGEGVPSLDDIRRTGNLAERFDLARRRHEQLSRSAPGSGLRYPSAPGKAPKGETPKQAGPEAPATRDFAAAISRNASAGPTAGEADRMAGVVVFHHKNAPPTGTSEASARILRLDGGKISPAKRSSGEGAGQAGEKAPAGDRARGDDAREGTRAAGQEIRRALRELDRESTAPAQENEPAFALPALISEPPQEAPQKGRRGLVWLGMALMLLAGIGLGAYMGTRFAPQPQGPLARAPLDQGLSDEGLGASGPLARPEPHEAGAKADAGAPESSAQEIASIGGAPDEAGSRDAGIQASGAPKPDAPGSGRPSSEGALSQAGAAGTAASEPQVAASASDAGAQPGRASGAKDTPGSRQAGAAASGIQPDQSARPESPARAPAALEEAPAVAALDAPAALPAPALQGAAPDAAAARPEAPKARPSGQSPSAAAPAMPSIAMADPLPAPAGKAAPRRAAPGADLAQSEPQAMRRLPEKAGLGMPDVPGGSSDRPRAAAPAADGSERVGRPPQVQARSLFASGAEANAAMPAIEEAPIRPETLASIADRGRPGPIDDAGSAAASGPAPSASWQDRAAMAAALTDRNAALPARLAPDASPKEPEGPPQIDLSHYRIIFSAPSGVAKDRLEAIMGALRSTGYPLEKPRRVGFTVSRTNLRYFHPEDRQAAELLAAAVGGKVRDFTNFRPSPKPGTIEIWLKGQPARGTRRARAGSGRNAELQRLRQKILQSLRRGDVLRRRGN